MRAAALIVTCLALSIAGAPASAQTGAAAPAGTAVPRVTNGRVVPQAAGGSLDAAFKRLAEAQQEPAWIGYAVPAVTRDGRHCCSGDTWISDGIVFTNRSEERRVGKECRSRWWQYHYKEKSRREHVSNTSVQTT